MGKRKPQKKTMSKKQQLQRESIHPPLTIGDRVRVKDNVMDPDYADQCIGGWTGTIIEINADSDPPLALIAWDETTLTELIGEEMLERADQEGLEGSRMWLYLTEMERADLAQSTHPPQPAKPAAKLREDYGIPLSDEEIRVTRIFDLPEGEEPPDVTEETLEIYYQYLHAHLHFPFAGEYSRETGPLQDTSYQIKVTSLLGMEECEEFYGLLCEGREGRRHAVVPLAEIEVDRKDANYQLIEDYKVWFWNYR